MLGHWAGSTADFSLPIGMLELQWTTAGARTPLVGTSYVPTDPGKYLPRRSHTAEFAAGAVALFVSHRTLRSLWASGVARRRFGHGAYPTSVRPASVRPAAEVSSIIAGLPQDLHDVVTREIEAAFRHTPADKGSPCVMVVASKEGPGPIGGVAVESNRGGGGNSQSPQTPVLLRNLPPDSVDVVVEAVASEMGMVGGMTRWQCHFYPLGGHEFSLARSFILNLASVAKVLRPGGKFIFRTIAPTDDEVLPFAFLRLRHLVWDVHVVRTVIDPSDALRSTAVVVCTVPMTGANDALAAHTPAVVAQECADEESRRRYADVIRGMLRRSRVRPARISAAAAFGGGARFSDADRVTVLDVGGGDGSLAAWLVDPDASAEGGPYHVTLMETNEELAERAARRLPQEATRIVAHGDGPWPFADGEFNVVVLGFMLHHIRSRNKKLDVLREACRVSNTSVVVLEDQPSAAASSAAQRLAWLVTEEHFRPFGQDPADYLHGVLPDPEWRDMFESAALEVQECLPLSGTLRHPVPHIAYHLVPRA